MNSDCHIVETEIIAKLNFQSGWHRHSYVATYVHSYTYKVQEYHTSQLMLQKSIHQEMRYPVSYVGVWYCSSQFVCTQWLSWYNAIAILMTLG